ncbi:HD domain-containing protein [Chloroflexota bacterium]
MTSNSSSSQQVPQETGDEKTLADDVEEYASSLLRHHKPQKITERKVIHCPILGSNLFEPYEIALIDSPFCQRLRRISQTDVASLVYPSANHNRLEHSLGVATIAGRVLEALLRRQPLGSSGLMTRTTQIEVRFAAILHDIGHGVFSHLSEETFQDFPEVELHRKENPEQFERDSPHEMISHLIIKSPSFGEYFKKNIIKEYGLPAEISLERIANSVIPAGSRDEDYGWQANIINGPFDADKFDYLQRDAYFSGLKIGIDLDRFLQCVWLEVKSGKPRQLKIMTSGATTLEQILFGKLMLYNTIYHHQKIRAAECAIKGIFEILKKHQGEPAYQIHGRKMNRAIDFLYVTEEDILSLDNKPKELHDYIRRFLKRDLFKRALVISADAVVAPDTSPGYKDFKSLVEKPEKLKELRGELVAALNDKYLLHEIWIDLPQTLTFNDDSFAVIQDENAEPQYMRDRFRVSEWLTAYGSNKWKGYVFCPPELPTEEREKVGKEAAQLLSDKYQFAFNIDDALGQAKIR